MEDGRGARWGFLQGSVWLSQGSTKGVFVVMEEIWVLTVVVVTWPYIWQNDTEPHAHIAISSLCGLGYGAIIMHQWDRMKGTQDPSVLSLLTSSESTIISKWKVKKKKKKVEGAAVPLQETSLGLNDCSFHNHGPSPRLPVWPSSRSQAGVWLSVACCSG